MADDTASEAAAANDVNEEAADRAAEAPRRRGRSGRGVAYLALLLALAGGAVAGYQYWLGMTRDERMAALADELVEVGRAARRADASARQTAQLRTELARVRQEQERQEQAIEETRGSLAEAVTAAREQQPPGPLQWRIAELEHLLRGANQRLVLEGDVPGARRLLESADEVLAALDDFALHEVRALVAEDMAALAAYRGADLQGVFLRLEALRDGLRDLPLRLPEFTRSNQASGQQAASETPADENAEQSFFGAVLARLKGLVRVRRHDGAALRPLLPPEQAEYLEQHLLLALDRAQLAVLRRHQAVFDASLATADEWLADYLDTEHDAVRRLRAEFAELRQVDLAGAPPDLSRPLARLRQLRRNAAPLPRSAAERDGSAVGSTPQ